ncbi:DUF4179 domain-containing protein [Paenibacillus contaminans]|uniref:DUF4179 domain-containing protein n=1 Tax=Paenibacillus contaminans TaxID=450362 RepID=A0A329MU62_9BACL|nr:DUF4179 domain-containing protein [Paenibacillus contaminans]RAV23120.1 DUF4179 domain-containing protein [Paenibacillus contaminans]
MSISKKIEQALTKHVEEIEIPEEVDQRVRQAFIQFHQQKETNKMKKKLIVFSIAAAVLIPTGVFASIGGSSYFFNKEANINGLVDNGVKQALSEGSSVPLDVKIKDQGITVHFKELYTEDTKILIHYSMELEDGSLVPYVFDTTGLNVRSDGKENGKQTENPTYQQSGLEGFNVLPFIGTDKKDNLPFYLTDSAGKEIETGIAEKDKPEGVIAFVTSGTKLPQSVDLNVNINRIGTMTGSWKGKISIDVGKIK